MWDAGTIHLFRGEGANQIDKSKWYETGWFYAAFGEPKVIFGAGYSTPFSPAPPPRKSPPPCPFMLSSPVPPTSESASAEPMIVSFPPLPMIVQGPAAWG